MKKTPKAIGIINVIFGAITACVGINDIDYDWGIIALVCGLGLLVSGILQLVNKTGKVLGILQLIAGIAEIGLACLCIDYDWGIISGLIGIGMFVIGIIETRNKVGKAKHIIGIVFGNCTFSMRYRRTGSEAVRR